MQSGKSSHGIQRKWYQQKGQHQRKHSLEEIGDNGGGQAPRYAVKHEQHRHHQNRGIAVHRAAGKRLYHGSGAQLQYADIDNQQPDADHSV